MRVRLAIIFGVFLGAACSGSDGDPMGDPDPMESDSSVPEMTMDAAVEPDAGESAEPDPVLEARGTFEDHNPDPKIVEVDLSADYGMVELTSGLEVRMMTYNGSVPGPLLEAKVGDEVIVHFENHLDEPTTIHWHGLRIPDEMDGSPRIQEPVPPGGTFTYRFVVPDAGTYWYHPHVRSNEQVEKGLYGPIIIRGEDEPMYDRERILVFDDILIDPDTQMLPPFLTSHPEFVHGRFGNLLLTNGRGSEDAVGTAEVGDIERIRIVNSANARTMKLSFTGAKVRVIGTDGGLLREPYDALGLVLPVGQRYDLEVTYTEPGAASIQISAPSAGGGFSLLDLYRVEVAASDKTPRVIEWPALPAREERAIDRELTFELMPAQDAVGNITWQINGMAHPHEPLATFANGETVLLTLDNLGGPEHPFHLHGQFFEVVDTGSPFATEPGLKDTVLVPGATRIQIRAYMDNPGRWMAHCHILEHAELGMMGEIVIEE